MAFLSKPSSAAQLAIVYVTVGALTGVWSTIWYFYLSRHQEQYADSPQWYWCYGFLLTGLVLMIIGFGLGRLGRAARTAELPPADEKGSTDHVPVAAPAVPAAPQAVPSVPGSGPLVVAAPAAPVHRH
jgi:hypothetical protein